MTNEIKTIISDLGNVLINFDFTKVKRMMLIYSGIKLPDKLSQIINGVPVANLVRKYDVGEKSSMEFYKSLKKKLKLEINYGQFKSMWNDIFLENKNNLRLMRKLKRSGYKMALISNTNKLHYEYISYNFPAVEEIFENRVLSYKVGIMKPDPMIYAKALALSHTDNPSEAVYIDDIRNYARAASKIGIKGVHYNLKKLRSDGKGNLDDLLRKEGIRIN